MTGFEITPIESTEGKACQIFLGETSGELPRHLLVGTKECAYLVREGELVEHFGQNISEYNRKRFLVIHEEDVKPFSYLFTLDKTEAFGLLQELSAALLLLPPEFLQSNDGFIELWRIWFIDSDGILFLSRKISDTILVSVDDETRYQWSGRYRRTSIEVPFALCHQLTQLLYQILTGIAPYGEKQARYDAYRHIPLAYYGYGAALAEFVDSTLALPPRLQRIEFSAAYSTTQNVSWFMQATGQLDLASLATPELALIEKFKADQEKRVNFKQFLRRRGALLVSSLVILIIVLSMTVSAIRGALEPPYTAELSAPEVIAEFFEAQNRLDGESMRAPLARGVKNIFEHEVTTLFVNSQVRQAYESFNPIVAAPIWLAAKNEPLPYGSLVYGVDDVVIKADGPQSYLVTLNYYYPERRDEGSVDFWVGQSALTLRFTVTDVKGYVQITSIEQLENQEVNQHLVKTYAP